MIEIYVNPTRVHKVSFVPGSPLEEDFDLAAWRVIRPLVDEMDRRLKEVVRELFGKQDEGVEV